MKLHHDACAFLWVAGGDPRLSKTANAGDLDVANRIVLSASSCAETGAKVKARTLAIPLPPHGSSAFARDECGVLHGFRRSVGSRVCVQLDRTEQHRGMREVHARPA